MKTLLARFYRSLLLLLVKRALRLVHAKFNVTGVSIFFDKQSRVLVLHHVYRHHHPWGLPAGFINADETPEVGVLYDPE